jgi:hypothetical protein
MLWLPVSKYDDYRVFSHLDDGFVVLRAHGIIDLDQSSLIGAAIGECIRHDDPAISPTGRCFSIPERALACSPS